MTRICVEAAHTNKKKGLAGEGWGGGKRRERAASFRGAPSLYLHASPLVTELGFEIEEINCVLSKEKAELSLNLLTQLKSHCLSALSL